jgi:ABC-type nitrate/sulfonate/bicarbonate transport system permease component
MDSRLPPPVNTLRSEHTALGGMTANVLRVIADVLVGTASAAATGIAAAALLGGWCSCSRSPVR